VTAKLRVTADIVVFADADVEPALVTATREVAAPRATTRELAALLASHVGMTRHILVFDIVEAALVSSQLAHCPMTSLRDGCVFVRRPFCGGPIR
jgi:hypothetical protein